MNKLYNDTAVQAIANAIRAKNGSSDTYTIAEMSTALNDISYYAKPIISNVPIATFEADGLPLNSLKVSVEAKQDLHGYDKPWVGGAGKNKFDKDAQDTSKGFVQGRYLLNNGNEQNPSAPSEWNISEYIPVKPNTQYMLSGLPTSDANVPSLCQYDADKNFLTGLNYLNSSTRGIVTQATTAYVRLSIPTTNANVMQLEEGSTATSFAPYSNICPISGWDAANVSDVDDVDNPTVTQTTTISLGQTVYGGEVDVVNGVLKLTHKIKVFDGVTNPFTITNDGVLLVDNAMSDGKADELISNQREYGTIITGARGAINYPNKICVQALNGIRLALYDASYTTAEDFNTFLASNPMQVCYELAEPVITNLTPSLIKSINGQNNLSVDCGEVIELEYFKEV